MKAHSPPVPTVYDWFPAAMEIMEAVYKGCLRFRHREFWR